MCVWQNYLADLLTSHQWVPEVFMKSTHSGSDFENTSMSISLSQEILSSTLVMQLVAPDTGGPPAAITTCRPHTHTEILTNTDKQPYNQEKKKKNRAHTEAVRLLL